MRKNFSVFLLFIMTGLFLVGCEAQGSIPFSELYNRNGVSEIQITYMNYGPDAKGQLLPGDSDFSLLLDALFAAPVSKTTVTAYSPEMNASHKISLLSATDQDIIAYYDAWIKLLSVATYRQGSGDSKILTYLLYDAELSTILNALEGEATAPLEVAEEEPDLPAIAGLFAEVIPEDLAKEGTPIDYELFEYPTQIAEPFFEIQTYKDGIEGLENGYLLAVAAWGEKPKSGYTIDIRDIIENDDYYVIHVERETPPEEQGDPVYPLAAALIDARRMSGHKLIVFVGENDEILNVIRLDREFFQNLPEDMPPLVEIDPMEEEAAE